ncbi:hypothetical protein NZK35_17555 [Stieleria sp. ICT_E10.1]|uniref:hypothetical protein n=1 Tax=Stieleria sedimenti TaxID=2976331 RepID=UPI00218015F0|nr:hypothetical protein [Stieleria sedimenti]MCS7468462.1 hypothetical protein [Stieleria sedimenti]
MNKSEIHAGYDFESGMFSRMRSWVDVASWIRLTRIPRILASPSHVSVVLIACVVTRTVGSFFLGGRLGLAPVWELHSHIRMLGAIFDTTGPLFGSLLVAVMLIVWIPVLQFVCRDGAALAAGKPLPRAGRTLRLVGARLGRSLFVPILPCLCIVALLVGVFLIRVPSFVADIPVVSGITGWAIGIAAIPVGILGFGALFAVPLALVAMVCEPTPDPIDSLSRGYESLYRRPLSLIGYVVFSGAVVFLFGLLLGGIGGASVLAAQIVASVISPNGAQFQAAADAITMVVVAWQTTLAFGLLGGIYLLLRSDTGGQEAEDLWEPPAAPVEPLPELPKEAIDG